MCRVYMHGFVLEWKRNERKEGRKISCIWHGVEGFLFYGAGFDTVFPVCLYFY